MSKITNKNKRNISPRVMIYLFLTAGAITMVFPFVWMITTSFKSSLEVLSARVSLIPEAKKYIEIDREREQVEFALALKLKREVSRGEGEIAGLIGAEIDGRPKLQAALSNTFSSLRLRIEKLFARYPSPERVEEKTSELGATAERRLREAGIAETLSSPTRELFLARLDRLRTDLDRLAATAVAEDQPIPVVILAGERRGEEIEVPRNRIIRRRFLWENFREAWQAAPFARYFFNSILVSILVTSGQVLTSALAAYAFARMKFPLKEPLFLLLLATMMIPKQVILIPDYAIISWLGWVNTYAALVVPFLGAVFGIYFMRQHFETLPQDLFDAASIDGCGRFRTLFQIVLPISGPVILTVALFTFIMTWNELLWPLVMTNTPEMRPLQVGLAVFNQESGTDWELLMAASTFSILPLMIIFFAAQKYFVEGITRSGMKS
ncbi:MAG: carbohydrate ABC transporter permease [Candidatus Erginobacter occultus]|nr:carbohydrate ABC transporter permease [Candidatus Erginobacter occultus]